MSTLERSYQAVGSSNSCCSSKHRSRRPLNRFVRKVVRFSVTEVRKLLSEIEQGLTTVEEATTRRSRRPSSPKQAPSTSNHQNGSSSQTPRHRSPEQSRTPEPNPVPIPQPLEHEDLDRLFNPTTDSRALHNLLKGSLEENKALYLRKIQKELAMQIRQEHRLSRSSRGSRRGTKVIHGQRVPRRVRIIEGATRQDFSQGRGSLKRRAAASAYKKRKVCDYPAAFESFDDLNMRHIRRVSVFSTEFVAHQLCGGGGAERMSVIKWVFWKRRGE